MKIRNLQELRMVKMQTRYEIELQEQAFSTGMHDIRNKLLEAVKHTLREYTKEVVTSLIIEGLLRK